MDKIDSKKASAELLELTSCLPQTSISFVFAYGSGALPQVGVDSSKNMVDFVVVVDDASRWHAENLARNWRHYSFLKYFGSSRIANYQRRYAAKVYYNTLVKVGDRYVKYGVIETNNLIGDLLDWSHLYISGRLHKPVQIVRRRAHDDGNDGESAGNEYGADSEMLNIALRTNLESACHAALLLSPETIPWQEFCTKVCALSYDGDFRQTFGEDRQKVSKIVRANLPRFERLYLPVLRRMTKHVNIGSDRQISQDLSSPAVHHHLEMLPKTVQWNLQRRWNRDGNLRDIEEVIFQLSNTFHFPVYVSAAIRSIVFRSSVEQTLKNVLSAGIRKSAVYSLTKLMKMVRSIV